ncbi:hypothetical protein GCM10022223_07310 [Kineosporia mesophila]|uniref:DUF3618 domain-containing protein n=1 Tax=Kineosporia mesophila TaxID=566012 RepID=A0ABP6Z277_9ACTN|nr:DUF3618 domain-containing protein [Kineosporia mesophila]MCD5351111.1 DUF3618 domain-containing protein [Kineosporia mesophila]
MSDENGSRSADEIREDIDHTRDELANTVEALTARADVKTRATEKAHQVQDTARTKAQEVQGAARVKAQELKAKAGEVQQTAKVQAVAAKTAVTEQSKVTGEQARAKAGQARVIATEKAHVAQEAVQQQHRERPWLIPAVGGAAAFLTGLFVWLRRRGN